MAHLAKRKVWLPRVYNVMFACIYKRTCVSFNVAATARHDGRGDWFPMIARDLLMYVWVDWNMQGAVLVAVCRIYFRTCWSASCWEFKISSLLENMWVSNIEENIRGLLLYYVQTF